MLFKKSLLNNVTKRNIVKNSVIIRKMYTRQDFVHKLRFLTSFAIFVILFINTNSFCYANAQDINVQAKMYAQQGTNALKDKRYDDAIINFKKHLN